MWKVLGLEHVDRGEELRIWATFLEIRSLEAMG